MTNLAGSLGPHAHFIVGSYAIVAIVVTVLIVATFVDYRAQRAKLRDLDRAGVTRRSGRGANE